MCPSLWSQQGSRRLFRVLDSSGLPGLGTRLGKSALPNRCLREVPVFQRPCSPAPAPGWWRWPCSSLSWCSLQPSARCSCSPGRTRVSGDRLKDCCGRLAKKSGVGERWSSELKPRKNNLNRRKNSPSHFRPAFFSDNGFSG